MKQHFDYLDLVLILPWQTPMPEGTVWAIDQMQYLTEGKIYEVRGQINDDWLQVYAKGSGFHFGCWPIKYVELVSKRP